MDKSAALLLMGFLSTLMVALSFPASAQSRAQSRAIPTPDYSSGISVGPLSGANFNTPESDGRPGVKFFTLGAWAYKKGDYAHAVDMYKVAASWAYKPAEYNLGLMYFKGEGVPVNRPLGAAWMILAAERGDPLYAKARDLMVTALTNTQFVETDKLWSELRNTYGDKVALRRAETQWAWVANNETGSHVRGGAIGELAIGVENTGNAPKPLSATGKPLHMAVTAAGILQSGSIDGSVAYRQFQESSNPYSPIFLKHPAGTVTVGPLQQIKSAAGKSKATIDDSSPPSSSQQ